MPQLAKKTPASARPKRRKTKGVVYLQVGRRLGVVTGNGSRYEVPLPRGADVLDEVEVVVTVTKKGGGRL